MCCLLIVYKTEVKAVVSLEILYHLESLYIADQMVHLAYPQYTEYGPDHF